MPGDPTAPTPAAASSAPALTDRLVAWLAAHADATPDETAGFVEGWLDAALSDPVAGRAAEVVRAVADRLPRGGLETLRTVVEGELSDPELAGAVARHFGGAPDN